MKVGISSDHRGVYLKTELVEYLEHSGYEVINYGTDTSIEGRLVIKNILLAEEAGLGNGETPIFPIHIFKIKEGVNFDPDDPNYDLFKLACRVSAKRLFPNF